MTTPEWRSISTLHRDWRNWLHGCSTLWCRQCNSCISSDKQSQPVFA